jgi:hypothetical protein
VITLAYKITDTSGVDSVWWSLNGTRRGYLAAGAGDKYTITAEFSPSHENSIIITAIDKSSTRNSSSVSIDLDYNRPPVANAPDTIQTRRNIAREITIDASDPDGDSIMKWSIISGPFKGTVSEKDKKTFTYTPETTFEGRDSITYRAWDASDSSDPGTIVIIITPNDIAPVFSVKPQNTSKDSGTPVTFTSDINSDVYPLPEYQWVKGKDTVGTTGPDFTISSLKYSHQGEYKLIVTNRAATIEAPFTLSVTDKTAPVITLSGAADTTILLNGTWNEPGFSAIDDKEGNINENIMITGGVTTTSIGKYIINYNITDAAGNPSIQKMRIVRVEGWVKEAELNTSDFRSVLTDDGSFYILYIDYSDSRAKVATLSNGVLVQVGSDITINETHNISMALSNDRKVPYVVTENGVVKKLEGSIWKTVIDDDLPCDDDFISLSIGNNNVPFVAYHSFKMPYPPQISKAELNTWSLVSSIDSIPFDGSFSSNGVASTDKQILTFSPDGTLYVIGNSGTFLGVVCKKLIDNKWVAAGNDSIVKVPSDGDRWGNNLHLLSYNNTMYCGYSQGEAIVNPTILRFNGTTWSELPLLEKNLNIGGVGFSMAISSTGILHAVYIQYDANGIYNFIIRSFNGTSWENIPNIGSSIAFQDECGGASIVSGPDECYITYLQGIDNGNGKTIIRHWC